MKTYGSRPHDKARCAYGCCGGKLTSAYQGCKGERAARKAARKRARQEALRGIREEGGSVTPDAGADKQDPA